jgi:hypothetical protein
MGRSRRATLRCVTEDLASDWTTPSDLANAKRLRELAHQAADGDIPDSVVRKQLRLLPPLSQLHHPLILAFDDQFSGEDDVGALRETISAVNDRQWFKQTYSARWRGAAAILEQDGEETAWLGAAGYHREGSPEDFYNEFARRCRSGSDAFLPADEDFTVRRIEVNVARLDAWKLQLHLTALVLLDAAVNNPENTYNTTVLSPDSTELLTLSMLVVQTDVDGALAHELVVEVVPAGWEHPNLYDRASIIVKTAIEPQFEAWTSAPLNDNAESHWTVLTAEAMSAARAAADSGTLAADARPGEVRLGTIAHYSHHDHIAYASVHGEAIRAMCGHWFVPTADHESKPVCATCREEYANTPA